jgi:BMFP domain-containing protein YqiC
MASASVMKNTSSGADNDALRSRIKDLELALSTTKSTTKQLSSKALSMVTPSASNTNVVNIISNEGDDSMGNTETSNSSTRSASVCKLVEALNRAAHEVETPKPWPRYSHQINNIAYSVLKDSTNIVMQTPNIATLTSVDQSISKFHTLKKTHSQPQMPGNTASKPQQQQIVVVGTDAKRALITSQSDKMIELLNKLDTKEKQIITLTAENVQLKGKVAKMKSHMKGVLAGQQQQQLQAQLQASGDKDSNNNNIANIQKVEDMNSQLQHDLTARIEELKKEAEEKLIQAAVCVESLQKALDEKVVEVKEKSRIIRRLEEQLANSNTTDVAPSNPSNEPRTPAPNSSPKRDHNNTNNNNLDNNSSADENAVLRKKYNELTKVYNDSCKTHSDMKATMGQAVSKLKQFIQELDEKTMLLNQSRQENDQLKARICVLERGGNMMDMNAAASSSSCILANSYDNIATMDVTEQSFVLQSINPEEQHHRIAYLRQAFSRMFAHSSGCTSPSASTPPSVMEMQSLGRVICSLLCIEGAAQKEIIEGIGKMSTAASVSNGLLNVFSIFD